MKDIGEKKFVVIPFFGVINFTKLNYFILEMLEKKIWANFQRIIELLYHRERILETSTLSCNEEEEEITKPPKR